MTRTGFIRFIDGICLGGPSDCPFKNASEFTNGSFASFNSLEASLTKQLGDAKYIGTTYFTLAYPQMIALRFDVGVDHLIVEELCGLRTASNTPVVIIEQATEERELSLPVQDLDLHEITKLPSECLHVLVEPCNVALDMRTQ
jgi:hypothetical protein